MGMAEINISMYIEWFKPYMIYVFTMMGTFSYMDNVQRNLLRASVFDT